MRRHCNNSKLKQVLHEIALANKHSKMEDWYSVQTFHFIKLGIQGGRSVLRMFGDSPLKAVIAGFPEHNWEIWRFGVVPTRFWDDRHNQLKYMEWLKATYNDEKGLNNWYKIEKRHFSNNHGEPLLHKYGFSPAKTVMALYPTVWIDGHEWHEWKFSCVTKGYWKTHSNRRRYLEWLGNKLGFSCQEHWYKIQTTDFFANFGAGLLQVFGGSAKLTVQKTFTELVWECWRFNGNSEYDNINQSATAEPSENLLTYHESTCGESSNCIVPNLTLFNQLRSVQFWSIIDRNARIFDTNNKTITQQHLKNLLSELFPDISILENYEHPSLLYSDKQEQVKIDLFLPAKNLVFEYQGVQHYSNLIYFGKVMQQRDIEKRKLYENVGLTVLEIPYWWDRKKESLREIAIPFLKHNRQIEC